jgi:hypothetical protein
VFYVVQLILKWVYKKSSLSLRINCFVKKYRPNNSPSRHFNPYADFKWVQWHLKYIRWIVSRPCSVILCVYEPRQIEPCFIGKESDVLLVNIIKQIVVTPITKLDSLEIIRRVKLLDHCTFVWAYMQGFFQDLSRGFITKS